MSDYVGNIRRAEKIRASFYSYSFFFDASILKKKTHEIPLNFVRIQRKMIKLIK